jgi:D-alanyl-D-alanine carboxypeptidase
MNKGLLFFRCNRVINPLKYLTVITAAVLISFSLTGCGGGGDGGTVTPSSTTKSALHNLSSFNINYSVNTSLSSSCSGVIADSVVLVTVPAGVSLTSLIPDFSISSKAVLSINGSEVISGKTPIDMTNAVRMTVTAENGTAHSYYWLLARNGNAAFDNEVYALMKNYHIPGVSLAATQKEKLVYSAGYGFAETESHTRLTPNMLFRLGSVSKQQTTLCIMRLYEEGKLNMSDHIFGDGGILGNEFPETSTNPLVPGAASITVENLLEHNSGWSSNVFEPIFDTEGTAYDGKTLDERINYMIHNQKLSYAVGSTYSYFNMGFCILGRVIEKLTGETYETYLRETMAKAGVTDMWVDKTNKADRRSNEVVFYSQSGTNGYHNPMDVVAACGGVIASAPDLMQIMCHEDYGTDIPDILSKSTLDLMYTQSPNYLYYAHGWRINHTVFTKWGSYHGGNLAGTGTLWARGKYGVNAVILCNSRSYDKYEGTSFDVALFNILGTVMSGLGD